MLSKDELAGFKNRLEKERAILEKELGNLGARNPANPSDWVPAKAEGEEFSPDRNDNADIIEGMQNDNASMNELEGRLSMVMEALAKVEKGTYGVCDACGEPIEAARLSANPAATTCVAHMNPKS